ncbi:MAG: hypothetical protein AAGB00_00240 [Planctomycetota bacterium]
MDLFTTLLIIAALVAAFGGIAYYAHLQEKKRRELLAAFALELGWEFDPTTDRTLDDRFPQFDCFRRGDSRYAHNSLRGSLLLATGAAEECNLHAQAGDYHYTVTSGSGKNRTTTTYRFSYLMIMAPTTAGHDLRIKRENWGDKMKAAMGFDDIDFESAEFSDRFWVKSRDKRFAYDVIHPRMMEFLMNGPTPTIEIDRGVLCLYGSGSRWEPHEFKMRMRWASGFFALWPRHLLAT